MRPPAAPATPSDHLIFLTNRVGRQLATATLRNFTFEGFRPQGIHIGLIADLITQDGRHQQDLAISTIKDKGSVARALALLETEGFVSRKIDPDDRRQKIIRLTDRGIALWKQVELRSVQSLQAVTQDLNLSDLTTCTRVLARIHQNLHDQLSSPSHE